MGQSERSLMRLGRRVAEQQDEAPEARLDRSAGRARLLAGGRSARRLRRRIRAGASRSASCARLAAALLARGAGARRWLRAACGELGREVGRASGRRSRASSARGSPRRRGPSCPSASRTARCSASRRAGAPGSPRWTRTGRRSPWSAARSISRSCTATRPGGRCGSGPFQVHVIGTRFETRWDPMTEQFGVALREGAITVSGPVVGEGARRARRRAAHRLGREGTLEVASIDPADRARRRARSRAAPGGGLRPPAPSSRGAGERAVETPARRRGVAPRLRRTRERARRGRSASPPRAAAAARPRRRAGGRSRSTPATRTRSPRPSARASTRSAAPRARAICARSATRPGSGAARRAPCRRSRRCARGSPARRRRRRPRSCSGGSRRTRARTTRAPRAGSPAT